MKLFVFMNQKLSIEHIKCHYGRFWMLVVGCYMIAMLLYIGYWYGGHHSQLKASAPLQKRLDDLYQSVEQQTQQINFLKVEVEVERQAAQYLQQQLQQLHQENYDLQKQLSFYQRIMAPELQAGGLEIDTFDLKKTKASGVYYYRLVLLQTKKDKRYAKGYVQMLFNGVQAGKVHQYQLTQLTPDTEHNSLPFSFQYFQVFEGDLLIPESFSLDSIDISIILPSGKWQKFARLDRRFPFDSF